MVDCNIFKTEIKKWHIFSISLINLKPDGTFEIVDIDDNNQTDDQSSAPTNWIISGCEGQGGFGFIWERVYIAENKAT